MTERHINKIAKHTTEDACVNSNHKNITESHVNKSQKHNRRGVCSYGSQKHYQKAC